MIQLLLVLSMVLQPIAALAQTHAAAVAPNSSAAWGSGGVNSPYAPMPGGGGTMGYGGMGMGMGQNRGQSGYGGYVGYGQGGYGAGTSGAGANPTTSMASMFILNTLFGEGDFTSRLENLILRGAALFAFIRLTGGAGLASPTMTGAILGTGTSGSNRLSTRPKSAAESSDPRLNICAQSKMQGPTPEVNALNNDLVKILY